MSVKMNEVKSVKSFILSRLSSSLDEIIKLEVCQSGMLDESETTVTDVTRTLLTELGFTLSDLLDENENN